MKVYQLLFLGWGILFAMWLLSQFKQHNQRVDQRRREQLKSPEQ
jgi:hypothetical protein